MPTSPGYLLDTNIVLFATREHSDVSAAIDSQFHLRELRTRPAICEVTVAELLAFAQSQSWGEKRRTRLRTVIADLLVINISEPGIHERWAELYWHARTRGLGIQEAHNDLWIAATAGVAGLTLLSTDASAYQPLTGTDWLDVVLLDPKTGLRL
jgi:predicted nucleic acid-binding protein